MNDNILLYENEYLDERYYRVEHKSGLTVYFFPKDRQSSCAILCCEYGSIDNSFVDENGKVVRIPDGVAHFLEHKMFESEDGKSVEEKFSRLSADPNAFTKWDATAYFFNCTDNEKFYPCLDELIDFVMTPAFTDESVEREKGIIGQEILMCEDDPYDRCFLNLVGGLYEKNPVRRDVAGSIKSISKINADLLRACHRRFYAPANMVLIVCGDLALEGVMEAVDGFFAEDKYRSANRPERKKIREKKSVNSPYVSVSMPVDRPTFTVGFKDDCKYKDGRELLKRQILAEILNELIFSSSGELYTDLYKRGIMTTPFSYGSEYGKTFSFVYAGGECDDPDLLLDEINAYIEKLKQTGVSREDFERRRKMTYSSNIKLFDSTWDIASAILDDALIGVELFDEFEIINELSPDDADELLKKLYCPEKKTFSTVVPKNN